MDMIDEDLKAFLIEGYENLNQIEGDLVALEQNPDDLDLMHRIYRALHTLKGNCGFLGLSKLESVAHAGENLLSKLRDRNLFLTPEITTALLQVIDAVRHILTTLESTGEEGEADFSELRATLEFLQTGDVDGEDQPSLEGENQESQAETQTSMESETVSTNTPTPQARPLEDEASTESTAGAPTPTASITESAIRVDVELLDKLVNLVGELVLCRNQILEFSNKQSNSALIDTSQRLNLVTTEMQEGVMRTRMQPIRNIWSKFPRVVRDLAQSLNKQVRLEMFGEDTELDKTLLEAITAPLTHLIRNCIDHGIELPDARLAAGKRAEGRLSLKAAHESGYVTIEIADNGAGINTEKLKQKALQRDRITSDQAARMSEQEILNLIFLPGFSMAKQVTNLSGRGVGMDVVRTNIEKIGGTIDVRSQRNAGTTFKLKIPLTLAIIPTLVVTCRAERYAIPQVNLLELVRLEGEEARRGVEKVHGAAVYRLRGNLLPLVYLDQELGLGDSPQLGPSDSDHESESHLEDTLNIVVLQTAEKPFGLIVDSINDTQEIVVKPLGKQLKGITIYAGATIMGDGSVALILDVPGLAQRVHMISDEPQENLSTTTTPELQAQDTSLQTLLLCQGPENRRLAIPLSGVARLEQFSRSTVERAGSQDVIQYRDQILPLIYLSSIFSSAGRPAPLPIIGETLQIVVVSRQKDTSQPNIVGLVVEQIEDIVAEQLTITGPATQDCVDCTTVVQNKIIEVLDIEAIAAIAVADLSPQAIAV